MADEVTYQPFLSWQQPVKNMRTSPPAALIGDRYIVTAVATGVWATHEDEIATYDGTAWWFMTPVTGWVTRDDTSKNLVQWDGAAWVVQQLIAVGTQTDSLLRWDGTNWVQGSARLGTDNDLGLYGGAAEDNSYGVYHADTLHAQYGINASENLYVQWRNGVAAPEYKNLYDQATNILNWSYDDGGGLIAAATLNLGTGAFAVTGNVTMSGDSPILTIGSGNGGPDINYLADAASDFRTHWHKDSASAALGSYRQLYDNGQKMLMQYHDGTAYRSVTRIVSATQYFLMEGAQGPCTITVGGTVNTGDSAKLVLRAGATGKPGTQYVDSGNESLFDEGAQEYLWSISGGNKMKLTAAGLALSGSTKILSMVTGVPTGGADGDFALRTDGAAGTMLYAKISGTWTALA